MPYEHKPCEIGLSKPARRANSGSVYCEHLPQFGR
jgi:hypothetical protein